MRLECLGGWSRGDGTSYLVGRVFHHMATSNDNEATYRCFVSANSVIGIPFLQSCQSVSGGRTDRPDRPVQRKAQISASKITIPQFDFRGHCSLLSKDGFDRILLTDSKLHHRLILSPSEDATNYSPIQIGRQTILTRKWVGQDLIRPL